MLDALKMNEWWIKLSSRMDFCLSLNRDMGSNLERAGVVEVWAEQSANVVCVYTYF